MRTTEFVQVWKKLYIFVQTPLSMKLRANDSVTKIYSFFLWLYSFLLVVQLYINIHMRTTEFVQLWKKLYIFVKTPLSMKLRAKDSVPKMYSFSLWLYSFLMVVQLFKNIHMRTTEFVQLSKKLYIFVPTPLSMKLRAKDSVPKMYSFFLWLYSYLLVVQLFRNIHMRTTEFLQVWKKLYIFVQTPLSMKFRAKNSVPKMYSFSLWLYSFLMVVQPFKNIHMRTTEFVQLWKKLYIFVQTPLSMKLRAKDSVPKMYSFSPWFYRFPMVVELFKNMHMRTTEFVELWKKLYIFVQTSLSMKLRAKDSVPKMYSFFLWLYSFSMVVQLFENIHMRTTEFVQVWKKLYILVQTPLSLKLRANDSVPKMYSCFLWLYSFLMVV